MSRMLPGIETLEQHRELLESNPDAYEPERCPRCGKAGQHHHGRYERKAPRGEGVALALGALIILRFFLGGVPGYVLAPVSQLVDTDRPRHLIRRARPRVTCERLGFELVRSYRLGSEPSPAQARICCARLGGSHRAPS
jgi:hypothetical protein